MKESSLEEALQCFKGVTAVGWFSGVWELCESSVGWVGILRWWYSF